MLEVMHVKKQIFLAAGLILLGFFLLSFLGVGGVWASSQTEKVSPAELDARYKTLQGEAIQIRTMGNTLAVLNRPYIQSKADLDAYITRGKNRLYSLSDTTQKFFAIVTFKQPLSEKEVKDAVGDAEILSLKYVSYPQGTGEHPYPITETVMNRLDALEKDIKTQMALYNKVKDFKLIQGYVAVKLLGTTTNLKSIQENQKVVLVDVGPVDEAQKEKSNDMKEIKVASTEDIYEEYNSYK